MIVSNELRDAANSGALSLLNGGPLRFYNSGGSRPAGPGSAVTGTLLGPCTLGSPAFTHLNGVATGAAVTPGTAIADGDADYARGFKSDGTTACADFSVSHQKDVTLVAAGDLVQQTAHGRTNGQRVRFGGTLTGTGLSLNTTYFVVNANANDHQVSATSGGAAIDITGAGSGVKCWKEAEIVFETSTIASGMSIAPSSIVITLPAGT